ncbi:MAG: hypothetical protein ACT4O0_20975 [Pseudonocardia sp.]
MTPQLMLSAVALVSLVAFWKEALLAVGMAALALMAVGVFQALTFLNLA